MIDAMFSIGHLIDIVRNGGSVQTGVDVYDRDGTLLLAGDVVVDQVKPLEIIKRNGLRSVPVAPGGGLFDQGGNRIQAAGEDGRTLPETEGVKGGAMETESHQAEADITRRLQEIQDIRNETALKYTQAKACLKNALNQVRETNGEFDAGEVADQVRKLVAFSLGADNPFSYMGRELFFYDDYLYSHAVNVCAMGTAVLHNFNRVFSKSIEKTLWAEPAGESAHTPPKFSYYYPDDMAEMSLGFFIFDMGKALVPESLLNKTSKLSRDDLAMIRRHSYEFGSQILDKNRMANSVLSSIVRYHHGPMYEGEANCYPRDKQVADIPAYVRICKLMDSYDAMISKRSYRDAQNQVTAVTELFRTYVKKDPMLQLILHAFVSSIGLHPPGSIVYLKNGQMAYVLESRGPIVLAFTDTDLAPLNAQPDPMDLGRMGPEYQVDGDRSVQTPKEVFDRLPQFIKTIAMPG
ncbi:MAG TPA: diguanylate cyclase [Desulfobacteraceae bacterium]|nr:diguanylate cyclase [Desulfobacteraceae bacterium]